VRRADMREYLFRGKTNSDDWMFGSLVYSEEIQPAIYFEVGTKCKQFDWAYVKPETVGEYTGLLAADSNRYTAEGEKDLRIFEGDILKHLGHLILVSWNKKKAEFEFGDSYKASVSEDAEIIGNIFDTPELLGGVRGGRINAQL
jgi:hypothetical protein